ncbi:hypothetical protein HDU97_007534 [Phlyctochytrium planicorne]|nr:hypothetical protein HDU97_007534 [Phlyctochytrium planicorne]
MDQDLWVVSFGVAKYIANVIGSPLQVVTILRQIEYCPRDSVVEDSGFESEYEESHDAENDEDTASDASGHESTDHSTFKDSSLVRPDSELLHSHTRHAGADLDGYLVRTGYERSDTLRPPYETSVVNVSSIGAMQALVRIRTEGFLSLWKGCNAQWFHDLGAMILQPSFESFITDVYGMQDEVIPLVHVENVGPYLTTLVASYTISEMVLSPLELIRTRMIAQTLHPVHKKYQNVYDGLQKVVKEEGFSSLYLNRAVIPTFLYYVLQSSFRFGTQLFLERALSLSVEDTPILYKCGEFGLKTLELLLLLPLETVRRRIYCQISKASEKPLETVVFSNRLPYTGFLDCLRRLMTEETASKRRKKAGARVEKKDSFSWSLGPLYRGFRLRLFANASIILLRSFSE